MRAANFFNNLSAAYNLSVIGLVLIMIGSEKDAEDVSTVSMAGMVGAVVGQVVLGALGDLIGTVRALLLTTLIVVVGAILSAALPPNSNLLSTGSASNTNFFTVLAVSRFVAGIGAGGMYPITASLTAEEQKRVMKRERMANARNLTSGRLVRDDDPDGEIQRRNSTREMLVIFSGQGIGQVLAPIMVYLTSSAFDSVDTAFRVTLAFGALPSLLALGLILRSIRKQYAEEGEGDEIARAIISRAGQHPDVANAMRENAELTASSRSGLRFEDEMGADDQFEEEEEEEEEGYQNDGDIGLEVEGRPRRVVSRRMATGGVLARVARVCRSLCRGKTFRALVGTGGTWFLFDVTFYANVVFASLVLEKVFGIKRTGEQGTTTSSGGNQTTPITTTGAAFARDISGPTALVLAIGLPGYFLAIPIARRVGLKRLQTFGFLVLSVLYGILAATFSVLPSPLLLTLYSATFLFSNCGPNSTTFCLPARTFPSSTRSTLNGVSAAMGKAGAILGTGVFPYVFDRGGPGAALGLSCGVAFFGCLLTHSAVMDDAPGLRRVVAVPGTTSSSASGRVIPTALEMSTPFRLAGDGSSAAAGNEMRGEKGRNGNGATDYDSNPFRKAVMHSGSVSIT